MLVVYLLYDDVVIVNCFVDYLYLSGVFVMIEIGKLKKFGLIDKCVDFDDKCKMWFMVMLVGLKLLKVFVDM